MAKIKVAYTVSELEVTCEPGEQLTFRHSARNKEYYILVRLSTYEAALVDVRAGELTAPGIFDCLWTETAAPQIQDPQFPTNPDKTIPDPDFVPSFSANLLDVIAAVSPGNSIKRFIKAGWRFEDHQNLRRIVEDMQDEVDPNPEA